MHTPVFLFRTRLAPPAEHVPAKWDFMYFFEAMDNADNGRIYPDFEREAPYIVLKLDHKEHGIR